ncbi:MAG: hypothetical protein WDZ32_02205 [Candidatus Saccharimonadales bacterium]
MEDSPDQSRSIDETLEGIDTDTDPAVLKIDVASLSDEELADLEELISKELGDRYQQCLEDADNMAKHIAGTGDIPPGYYDETKDPIARRRREISRKIVINTLAAGAIGAAALGVAAHRFKNRESQPEDKK